MNSTQFLNTIKETFKTRFEQSKRVLSFDEYLDLVFKNPYAHVRSSSHYILDALNHFTSTSVQVRGNSIRRFKIFDNAFAEHPAPVIAQESVQNALFQILTSFVRSGKTDKLIVLHGPNGSAKSSLIRALYRGLEKFSQETEGALFQFSWIFPLESLEKSTLGIGTKRDALDSIESFSKLDQEKIGAIVRSELRESPLALIPSEDRKTLFDSWIAETKDKDKKHKLESLRDHFLKSELSHRNALIFESLLSEYRGDYRKVLRHTRIERFYLSQKFRRGLVTVEPQFGVDATLRQVTLDKSLTNLPPALQSLNLFQIEGDLVDGNRGIVEYSDFLKRPVEHFKYLLSTCENSSVSLGSVMAFLDTLFLATTNDRQLEAFRDHPEYNSFKARLELIKVPYLLRYSDEEKIYMETAKAAAGPKELQPHTTKVLALWAVLTRLKKPILKNKSTTLSRILENLKPLDKAKLYDSGELPENLSDEERRELKGHIEELYNEHQEYPYYEGLLGASARELKVVLKMAAQNDQFPTLGPNAVFAELKKLVHKPMDYEYLRQEAVQGYHDFEGMISVVKEEWLDWVDREMRIALDLQNDEKIKDFLASYMKNITAAVRGERIKNRITGQAESADDSLMNEFETLIGASASGNIEDFRKNFISRLGAWSIEKGPQTPPKDLPFEEIFPDIFEKLRQALHEKQSQKVKLMASHLLDMSALDTALETETEKLSESAALAVLAYQKMQTKFGYGPKGAKEALVEVIKNRYLKGQDV